MSQQIVMNKSNIINTGNNKIRYKFPRDQQFSAEDTLAISHFNVYYSWFNISTKYNNNSFSYMWWGTDGVLDQSFDVVIPDGFYSVSTLYEYFQRTMVDNGHYLVLKETGDYMYFIELITNSTYYSVEWRLSSLSQSFDFNDGAGMVDIETKVHKPDALKWKIPSDEDRATPQLVIPSNNNFGSLIGFNDGSIYQPVPNVDGETYKVDTDQYSFLNDVAPNMEPSSSFIITCNLVDNDLGIPNNILYSFTIPNNITFGDLITSNTDIIYSKIKPGLHSHIDLAIYDQNWDPLQIIDPNLLIVLSIVKK